MDKSINVHLSSDAFSPAPLVPQFALTMPQSEPDGPTQRKTVDMFVVNIEDDRPCGTSLLIATASSNALNLKTYCRDRRGLAVWTSCRRFWTRYLTKIGTKSSVLTTAGEERTNGGRLGARPRVHVLGDAWSISTIVGVTKLPGPETTEPPQRILPPCCEGCSRYIYTQGWRAALLRTLYLPGAESLPGRRCTLSQQQLCAAAP